eukprot:TRINITY_DN64851_c0_g1_i1.p2 TRINITY_DN64851_c0_g1~~TRINITY_DN64851_c0_g1_i1.p2  ORF type:complete len:458 (+),score=158.41 TRINITY_DN64851_c0_g1_i1:101-1375(+)
MPLSPTATPSGSPASTPSQLPSSDTDALSPETSLDDSTATVDLTGVGVKVLPRLGRATLFSQPICKQSYEVPKTDKELAPAPRFGHTAVVYQDKMVIFAGRDSRCFGDVWMFSFTQKKWLEVAQSQPETERPMPRAGHTAVVHRKQMYVFGGVADHGGTGTHTLWLNDLWAFNLETFTWRKIREKGQKTPDRRKGHTAQVWNRSMFVYGGGQDDQTMHCDLWEFSFVRERWIQRNYTGHQPQARMYHVSAVTPGGKLMIFGGRAQTTTGFLNDLFQVDLRDFVCTRLEPKGTAPTHRMCSTAIYHNHTLAIFTGGSFAYLEDSHQLSLRTMEWTPIEDISFGGRTRPTTVKWNNTVLTFGGCVHGNGYVNDFVEVELEPMTLTQCVMEYMQEFGLSEELRAQPDVLPERVRDMLRPAPPTASAP